MALRIAALRGAFGIGLAAADPAAANTGDGTHTARPGYLRPEETMVTTVVLTDRAWSTTVKPAGLDAQALKTSPDHGTAHLPLITRTGFERRHVVTSQIASL
jgi:hypothetical protein